MRGNDERRSPAEGASTEAEVSAFEAVLIDPMQEKDEELKDRQFVTALARGRRAVVRGCEDWTERRIHLGGAVGAAIASATLDRGWVARRPSTRALAVTAVGHRGFAELGVEVVAPPVG